MRENSFYIPRDEVYRFDGTMSDIETKIYEQMGTYFQNAL